jgi:GT2 family glycosyltransferase
MVSLSIIVLNYNTKDLTLNCIQSLIKQYRKEIDNGIFEIILVDNASVDASVSEISNLNPPGGGQISNLYLVRNKENYGFAKGCNIGAQSAKGEYILFLNSDTEASDRGFLKMIDFMKNDSRIGILGGKLLNNDGSSQPSAGKFYTLLNLSILLLGLERIGFMKSSPDKIKKVEWVSGACMMVRKKFFEKLNGFDEKFFMYIEDMEICFRAKKAGFSTFFYPDLKLTHKSFGSSNRSFAIINIYKGILYFYKKHKNRTEYFFARLLLVLKAKVLIVLSTLTFNKRLKDTYIKALQF